MLRSILLIGFGLAATILLLAACRKSGGSSPSLQGTWTIVKYVATNFDTSGGKTALPNDTVYPQHTETLIFTKDSVYINTWETFIYFSSIRGDSFYNLQNRQFLDTAFFTATSSYYVEPRFAPDDTSYIVSLTDNSMVTRQGYLVDSATGMDLFDILTYCQKQ